MLPLKIKFAEKYPRQSFIAWAVERGLPWLDCEAANKRILALTIENMFLQAALDALVITNEEKK